MQAKPLSESSRRRDDNGHGYRIPSRLRSEHKWIIYMDYRTQSMALVYLHIKYRTLPNKTNMNVGFRFRQTKYKVKGCFFFIWNYTSFLSVL